MWEDPSLFQLKQEIENITIELWQIDGVAADICVVSTVT